jgi:hypothetical protein
MGYSNVKFSKTRDAGFELSNEDEARIKELQEHLEKDQIHYLWVTGKVNDKGNEQLIGIYVPIVKTLYLPSSNDSCEVYGYTGQCNVLTEMNLK